MITIGTASMVNATIATVKSRARPSVNPRVAVGLTDELACGLVR
jgi:hypothetical protein